MTVYAYDDGTVPPGGAPTDTMMSGQFDALTAQGWAPSVDPVNGPGWYTVAETPVPAFDPVTQSVRTSVVKLVDGSDWSYATAHVVVDLPPENIEARTWAERLQQLFDDLGPKWNTAQANLDAYEQAYRDALPALATAKADFQAATNNSQRFAALSDAILAQEEMTTQLAKAALLGRKLTERLGLLVLSAQLDVDPPPIDPT